MKWYRLYTLAALTGAVTGTLYGKCKKDEALRTTVLKLAGTSIAYTSVGFLATTFIPRLRYACYYVTLTSFLTSCNFLFTRQYLLEREWLIGKDKNSRINQYKASAVSGAETGLVLEGILMEGGFKSTFRAIGYWTLVGVALQFGWFVIEDWRIRKTLMIHRPDLYKPDDRVVMDIFFERLDKLMLGEWEIDRVRKENQRLNILVMRELDRIQQLKQVMEDNGIPCME